MSIMDHDPKYAELRAWREGYRARMIAEYHRYIKQCMFPPPALLRWVQQDRNWRIEQGLPLEFTDRVLMPVHTPLRDLMMRLSLPDQTMYIFKPIAEMITERLGAK